MAAPPAMQRITVGLAFVAVLIIRVLALLPGDEGRQTADFALAVAALLLRLRARLLLLPRIGLLLLIVALLLVAILVMLLARLMLKLIVAGRLRLAVTVAGLVLAEIVAVVVERLVALFAAALSTHERLLLSLPELLLRRSDQPEIMLGVLVVVFGRYRVAGRLRIARQLDVFLRDVRRGTPDLHVGAV